MAEHASIGEVSRRLRAGEVSPVDLVRTCLQRIEHRPELHAFITVLGDEALADARRAETALRNGGSPGPLLGIPISVKDLVDVVGTPTTSGSRVPPRWPVVDAPIVERLKAAGAIIIGKTNLHEFAFGTTSEESGFGPVRHPLDPARSAGGSSSGAAVALVEGMCYGSIGTDTGGSIRIPSAACGTVGLKATRGELPCDGIVPLSTTLDHVGPMARCVEDVTLMFNALRGIPAAGVEPQRKPFTVGVPRRYFCERLDPSVRAALDRVVRDLQAGGHQVRDVEIAHAAWTPDVYLHIVLSEAAAYHAPLLDNCADRYSPGVRMRLEMGRYVLAEDYIRALRLRQVLVQAVDAALEGLDALLLPSLPIPAPILGAASVELDGRPEPVRSVMLRLTQLFNITGHPAIALPAGVAPDGFPVGVQFVGRRGDTDALLAVAAAAEPIVTPTA